MPQLLLRRHEDKRIRGGHAWVFSNEVDTSITPLSAIEPGAAVVLLDHRRQFLGHALANPHALICARIVSRDPDEPFGPELLTARVRDALALRDRYVGGEHYRLVYGESDGLPGLVVDRFGDVLVGQIATVAMEQRSGLLEQVLGEVLQAPPDRVEERYRCARSGVAAARTALRWRAGAAGGGCRGGRCASVCAPG